MAALIRRKDSRKYWIKYRDERTGERKYESTGFRWDDPKDHKKARALEAELTSKERNYQASSRGDEWASWVPDYFQRHCKSPKSLERYKTAWSWVSFYLVDQRVLSPHQLTFQHALSYVAWRQQHKKRTGKMASKNTALYEVKLLGLVMREAVRLGVVSTSPIAHLGISKDRSKEKPEMTDKDISDCLGALKEKPLWMRRAFAISLHTGCRHAETRIATRFLDMDRKIITFADPKGGANRAYTIPMPDALFPLFVEIVASGDAFTLEMPPRPTIHWWRFFHHELKRTDLCFHCLRVTFVTRLARAGVPLSGAMRLVNHSSSLVHKIYQRLSIDDVRQWRGAVTLPTA